MKKLVSMTALALTSLSLFACGNNNQQKSTAGDKIEVVSREDGSGTRGAFTEITGILEKNGGKEVDNTAKSAVIQNNTEGVINTVTGNESAIGYVSLGSLNDNVKAVKIEDVKASSETVLDGSYKLQRPFNVVWGKELSGLGKDFLSFIHSTEGQLVVVNNKYVEAKTETKDYKASKQSGKLAIVGSTSVTPLMEKLAEAYKKLNPDVTIDITSNGSSAGITAAEEGTADIGMVSRDLTGTEGKKLQKDVIALDGIAVVVNKKNTIDSLKLDQVKAIFTGKSTSWEEFNK